MFRRLILMILMIAGSTFLTAAAGAAPVQEDNDDEQLFEKEGPQRRRSRMRGPERIRERIEQLRAQDPEDPRIERLERILEHVDSGRGGFGERGPRRRSFNDSPRFSPEEIEAFVAEHEGLHKFLNTARDGNPATPAEVERNIRRFGGQISEIMRAYKEGNEKLGALMIQGVELHLEIRRTLHDYHRTDEGAGERERLRAKLAELVSRQTRIEYQVEGQRLSALMARLQDQIEEHHASASKIDERAEKRLERMLSHNPRRRQRGN